MDKETINKLTFNFFLDNKKKEIDKIERANMLQKYLEDNNLSQRELATELGMSHSTLQDWIMYSRIDREEYDRLIENGYNHKQIYKTLRNTKTKMPNSFDLNLFRTAIKDCKSKLNPMINKGEIITNEEVTELKEIQNIINRIILNYERKLK